MMSLSLSSEASPAMYVDHVEAIERFVKTAGLLKLWTPETCYKDHRPNQYTPAGQCGVMNFGAAVYLVWQEFFEPEDLYYVEGAITDGDNVLDDKHAWIWLNLGEDQMQHIDTTVDQYEVFRKSFYRQALMGNIGTVRDAPYEVQTFPQGDKSTPASVRYLPQKVTRIDQYDTAAFDGRLISFLGSVLNPAAKLMRHDPEAKAEFGHPQPNTLYNEVWLPRNSGLDDSHCRGVLAQHRSNSQISWRAENRHEWD